MATMLEDLTAARTEITSLKAQLASLPGLTQEVATLKAEKATLTEQVTTANAATAAATAKGTKDLADAQAAHQVALTAKDAEVETKAATKAAAIVAGAGGAAVITEANDKPGAEQKPALKGSAAYKAAMREEIKKNK